MEEPHKLLPIAYRSASRILRNPLLAEEAGERAVHQLVLALLHGTPPHHPAAWIRVVAKRSALALLRSDWVRTPALDPEVIADVQAPYRRNRHAEASLVRERVEPTLPPRQRAALAAALSTSTTRDAARSAGMQPRDFRRHLARIQAKARNAFAEGLPDDPFADDVAVQFRLPS
jgi:DNA-directed RNA polymerase specialized sigma24 family protein